MEAAREHRIGRYLGYAIAEVGLIFIGITLAVGFDNASQQRNQDELVRGLLAGVSQNLEANVAELEANIAIDDTIRASLLIVIDHLTNGQEWDDSLSLDMAIALHWSSPFLATSGYESLKQSGLHQLPDTQLRADLIHLFEATYAFLVGDVDRSMWVFTEAVAAPTTFSELVRVDAGDERVGLFAPRDFEATVRKGLLRTMLMEHQSNLIGGTRVRQAAREETVEVMEAIQRYLGETGE